MNALPKWLATTTPTGVVIETEDAQTQVAVVTCNPAAAQRLAAAINEHAEMKRLLGAIADNAHLDGFRDIEVNLPTMADYEAVMSYATVKRA